MFEHGFPPYWSTIKKLIWLVGTGIVGGVTEIWKTVTGALIHITNALASPMQKCEVSLEPIQAGSGDPSPDNVRPITGWTGCEVTRTGANLLYANIVQGGIGSSGDNTTNAKRCRTGFNFCFPNQKYSASVESGKKILAVHFYREANNNSWISRNAYTSNFVTFTTPENCHRVRLLVANSNDTTNITPESITSMMISYGEESKPYEPYQGTTISVTFPDSAGTVYGGTVDLVSGVLTINEVKLTLNGNSSDGNYSRISSGRFNIDNLPINYFRNESAANSGESSQHKSLPQTSTNGQFDTLAANYSAAFDVSLNLSGNTLRIKDTRFDTVAELQAAYATEKPQFVLTLATPITIQLTPQQISTLKGENNVWSNSNGDTTLIYKAQAE